MMMRKSDYEIKKEICEIGKRIYMNGFVAANDGNITVKVDDNTFWATPTGVSKGYLTPDMLIKVDAEGKVLEGTWKPSSELKMHMRVYKERPDVGAVVHAHPPTATGFAIAHIPLDKYIMPEAVISLGTVPIAEYGTPSTNEIPDAVAQYLQTYDAVLLENHGALTMGPDLMNAYFKMESVEFFAKITLISMQLGGPKELNCEEIEKLLEVRRKFKMPGKHPGCPECEGKSCSLSTPHSSGSTDTDMDALVAAVTKKVLAELGK